MKKATVLLAIIATLSFGCSPESTPKEGDAQAASKTSKPKPEPTPTPTPNPNLTSEQRELVIQMYKEAVLIDKLYTEAFEQKSERLYKEARGIGFALVRRDEKDPQIMNHPGYYCYNAFMSINSSRASAWYELNNSEDLSDFTKQQLQSAKGHLQECENTAKETGILNEEQMEKPLPYIKPIEIK